MATLLLYACLLFEDSITTHKGESPTTGRITEIGLTEITIKVRSGQMELPTAVRTANIKNLSFDPGSFDGALREALKAFKKEDYKAAAQAFQEAVEKNGSNALAAKVALYYLAETCWLLNKHDTAVKASKQYLEKFREDYFTLLVSRRILEHSIERRKLDDANQAYAVFKKLADKIGDSRLQDDAERFRADICYAGGKNNEAADIFKRLYTSANQEAGEYAAIRLLAIYREDGEWDSIRSIHDRAVKKTSNKRLLEISHECIGEYYFNKGEFKTAMLSFLKVLLMYKTGKTEEFERALAFTAICMCEYRKGIEDKDRKEFYGNRAETYYASLKQIFPSSKLLPQVEKALQTLGK